VRVPARCVKVALCVLLLLVWASQAGAQSAETQLSAYTGENAEGYLQPLANAFGANLNSGLFRSAHIPLEGVNVSVEVVAMMALFADEDATFEATTEEGFHPETTVDAPTVVGSGEAVTVDGTWGTTFAFPGGLDLNSFALAAPQVRIGSFRGTEAIIRYIAVEVGDSDIGNVSLLGLGARHNVSQYFGPAFPVDMAVGFFWQKFDVGDDFIAANATTFGVQASKSFGFIEPYAGLAFDSFSMDVTYETGGSLSEEVGISLDSESSVHMTLGVGLQVAIVSAFAEYNIAGQSSLAFGIGFGF